MKPERRAYLVERLRSPDIGEVEVRDIYDELRLVRYTSVGEMVTMTRTSLLLLINGAKERAVAEALEKVRKK